MYRERDVYIYIYIYIHTYIHTHVHIQWLSQSAGQAAVAVVNNFQ